MLSGYCLMKALARKLALLQDCHCLSGIGAIGLAVKAVSRGK
jgi:hypothetical protein